MQYILDRAREPSTWRGLALLLGALGCNLAPDLIPAIGTAVGAVVGAIEVARKG
jgi:hypothetical protein